MKDKSPAFQWYPKQYLSDDKVLAMEWDARGMHHWLLNISWQQEPVGSIPDDVRTLRQWLGLPCGYAEADRTWSRVWPQIKAAWKSRDGRWFNDGIVRSWERQQTYKQNGSKSRANPKQRVEVEEEVAVDSREEKQLVSFRLETCDGSEAFERLCQVYKKSQRSALASQLFFEAVEWVVERRKLRRSEAAGYIISRAEIYCSKKPVKWQQKLTDWLNDRTFEQEESAWGDGVEKSDLDKLYGDES